MSEEFSEILDLDVDYGYGDHRTQGLLAEHMREHGDARTTFNVEYIECPETGGPQLWLYGPGDPMKAALYASTVMNEFRMSGHFFLHYCYRHDENQVGEFGGGVMVVTNEGVKALRMVDICNNEIANFLNDGGSVDDEIPVNL